MNTRIYQYLATGLCIAALAVGIAYSQTSNGDPPDNDIGGNDSPTGVTGGFNGMVDTGCAYDPYTGNAQRTITDIVVPGAVGAYPLKWSRLYGSRTADIGSGIPVGWIHSYHWTMSMYAGDWVGTPNGREIDFNEENPGISERRAGPGHILLGDGGQVIFEVVPYNLNNQQYNRWRLARIVDPHGLATQFSYETTRHDQNGNAFYRLVRITEPAGRYLQLSYSGSSENDFIAGVQAFDAQNNPTQSVVYTYAPFTPAGDTETYSVLTRVDYSDGTAAHYTYQNDNSARRGSPGIPLLHTCDDVRYGGAMRQIEYLYVAGDRIRGKLKSERKLGTGEAVSTLTFPSGRAAQTRLETRGDGPKRTFTYSSSGRVISHTDFKNSSAIVTRLTYDGVNRLRTVKNAMNHETTFTREPNIGQLTRLTHPGGIDYVDFGYSDPNNPYYLTSRRDERNHYTFFDRDGNHRVWQIRYPDGASETITYNGFGQVLTHKRKNGAYGHFEYDSRGRLERAWNPTSNPSRSYGEPYTTFQYYPSGHPWADRVSIVYDPQSHWTMYEYDYDSAAQPCAGRGLVTKVTHVDQTYLTFGYDAAGNVIWEENELRQRTTASYDDFNRPISIIPPAPAGPIALTYEPTFGPPNPYLHTARAVHFQTDGAGVTLENKYDENFRVKTTAQLDGTASPPTTSFDYWPIGTLWKVHDPRDYNSTTTRFYDSRSQLQTVTDAMDRTTIFTRDPAGNVERIDRPDSKQEFRTYDQLNRVLTQVEPLTDAASKTTTFTYWPSGKLRTVRDNNDQPTTFEYEESDLRSKMIYPDNTYQAWGYDRAKNLTSRRTVGGKTQLFYPDSRNRPMAMRWAGNGSDWADFGYDDAGRLITANNQSAMIARQYDPADRLIIEQQTVNGLPTKTIEYQSDGAGKAIGMGIAGTDYQFAYQYDAIGRFEQILNVQNTPNGTTKSLWYQYSYDAASNETQRYCPMNGVAQIYHRDEVGRIHTLLLQKATEPQYAAVPGGSVLDPVLPSLVQLPGLLAGLTNLLPKAGAEVPAVGTRFASEQYVYDAMDRVKNVYRQDGDNDGFGYDYSGQLTSASYSGQGRSVSYSLDAVGNRSQVNDNGNVQGYSSNQFYRNQYVSAPAGAVSNGAEHEIAGYGGLSYTYIGDRQLASVTGGGNSYYLSYDALGRCVKRALNGIATYYTYDGVSPIHEWKADGSRAGWNLYGKGVDEILLRGDYVIVSNGQGYFFQQNRLGSVTHLTGFSGETIERYRYDAFGQPTTLNPILGSFNNRFKFTGREYQPNLGIYEYRARAYHPGIGRFLSEDPIGFAGGDSNLFRYCGGDPANGTDPSGLATVNSRIGFQNEAMGGAVGQGLSTQGWWTNPDGTPTGVGPGSPGVPDGQGGGSDGGSGYSFGQVSMTQETTTPRIIVSSTFLPPPSFDFGSPFFGFQPGQISFGIDLSSSRRISLFSWPSTSQPLDYREYGPSSDELSPLQAALIGTYLMMRRGAVGTLVIGRTAHLQSLRGGERSLIGRLPDRGSHHANWRQNAGALRSEMNRGYPIRDASPGNRDGYFTNAERYLMHSRTWTYDSITNHWMPPGW